jgi:hypothetical protein
MTGEKKSLSIRRQCEKLVEELSAIFRASRHVGPRPDVVLRATLRCALAEYVTAPAEFLAEIEKSTGFEITGDDREVGWIAAEQERKRLFRLYIKKGRRLPGETLDEYMASGYTWRKVTRDENTLAVLRRELEKLAEPLPASTEKSR